MKGTYTIVVECKSGGYAVFGRLGRTRLQAGWYVYTGSAMGVGAASLERRIRRHEKHSKNIRWHIDYLTSKPGCLVRGVVYVVSKRRLECNINQHISEGLKLLPVLPRIGATDCNCPGHLLGPSNLNAEALLGHLANIYRRVEPRHAPMTVRSSD